MTRRVWHNCPRFALFTLGLTLGCGAAERGSNPDETSGGSDSAGGANASGKTGASGRGGNAATSGAGSGAGGRSGTGGGASTGGGGSDAGAGGEAGSPETRCEGSDVLIAKRMVRLSFHQLSATLHALFGDAFGAAADQKFLIGSRSPSPRTFPPLASAHEGSAIIPQVWKTCDQIATEAGAYTRANLGSITGCGDAPSDACARAFVDSFTEKVFRRPPTAEELASMRQVYEEALAISGAIPDAIATTVSALLSTPQFLYRAEFGGDSSQAGPLEPFEQANQLSYFLTDRPPDPALLDAAAHDSLASSAEIAEQVNRLLDTPVARKNYESALGSHFGIDSLFTVVIDDARYTSELRDSAYSEVTSFFQSTLWSGPLAGILTSRVGSINSAVASVYGVSLPAPVPDKSVFVELELPPARAGLLTRVGFLAARSRPDDGNLIGRGLALNATLLCGTNPPDAVETAPPSPVPPGLSERGKVEFRANLAECRPCHSLFDPLGLALDSYDLIGRYRTTDPQGRPIDPAVMLPPALNGAIAKDAVDMEAQIAKSPAFAQCFARNLLKWAFMEPLDLKPDSCVAKNVARAFTADDGSLSALLREIAVSSALRERKAGATQ